MKKRDIAYLLLPIVLWPIVFMAFSGTFVYAMAAATVFLAILTLALHPELVSWNKGRLTASLLYGLIGAAVLYLAFFMGYLAALALGLSGYVSLVYSLIYAQAPRLLVFLMLLVIGVSEEIYWRGGVQGFFNKHSKRFKGRGWMASTAYYSLVHLSTLNPILVVAAFLVGLISSLLAQKRGIAASIVAHVFWIELIIIFLPVLILK